MHHAQVHVFSGTAWAFSSGTLFAQVQEALNVGWRIGESVRSAAINAVASASSVGRSATRAAAGSFQEVGTVRLRNYGLSLSIFGRRFQWNACLCAWALGLTRCAGQPLKSFRNLFTLSIVTSIAAQR